LFHADVVSRATERSTSLRHRALASSSVRSMGTFYYGTSTETLRVEDHVLAHLKLVVVTKLRRDESFTISWTKPVSRGAGRCTLWVHPAIPLRFVFDTSEPVSVDRTLLNSLNESSFTARGIVIPTEALESCA
jgi:hypothetical protein